MERPRGSLTAGSCDGLIGKFTVRRPSDVRPISEPHCENHRYDILFAISRFIGTYCAI